ncbi:hypothetical protein HKX48_001733 [Thoreauomyces humboldtii]|nr:hypothetical protein HKX48_001733 [Thoreauomyces humboldtii]
MSAVSPLDPLAADFSWDFDLEIGDFLNYDPAQPPLLLPDFLHDSQQQQQQEEHFDASHFTCLGLPTELDLATAPELIDDLVDGGQHDTFLQSLSVDTGSFAADQPPPIPSPSSSNTNLEPPSAPPKRKRPRNSGPAGEPASRRKSCEPCRLKKLRCDRNKPHCTACMQSVQGASQCYYYKDVVNNQQKHIPAPEAASSISAAGQKSLEDRVAMLESLLAEAVSHRSSPETTATASPPPVTLPVACKSPVHLISPLLFPPKSIPPAHVCPPPPPPPAVSDAKFADLIDAFQHKLNVQAEEDIEFARHGVLPDLETTEVRMDLIDMYFKNPVGYSPVDYLHRQTFLENINNEPPLLLYALYAVMSSSTSDPRCRNSSNYFYNRARVLISDHLENPSLRGVQGLCFLATAAMAQGLMTASWMYLGMACRMAKFLKLDVEPEGTGLRWAEAESRRRMWWALINVDRIKASMSQRPRFLDDPIRPPKLPCPDAIWVLADANGNLPSDMEGMSLDSYTAGYCRFSALYARALEYNKEALRSGVDLDVVCPISTVLEAEIQAWAKSLPEVVQRVPHTEDYIFSTGQTPTSVPYLAVACHLIHKGALCVIRRPRIVAALIAGPTSPASVEAIKSAIAAADDIALMARRLSMPSGANPDVPHGAHVAFIYGGAILEAVFIFIIAGILARASGDDVAFHRHQHKIRDILQLGQITGRSAPPARIIGEMMSVLNEVLLPVTAGPVVTVGHAAWVKEIVSDRATDIVSAVLKGCTEPPAPSTSLMKIEIGALERRGGDPGVGTIAGAYLWNLCRDPFMTRIR